MPSVQAGSSKGAKLLPLVLSVGIGLVIRYVLPIPAGMDKSAWTLLAIFVSTIAGLILEPLPVGAWSFVAATLTLVTRTLNFTDLFAAFTNDVIWLIVVSFFFAKGFEKCGLGQRVANVFVKLFGKSTLGLAYGLGVAEIMVAPAMPSTTARAGGIFVPIISSLSQSAGSMPNDPSRKRLGSYLIQAQLQGSASSSALYLTAAAQNLLCMKLAAEAGIVISSTWATWFKAASVPALVSVFLTPLVMYKLFPPELKSTPDAPKMAARKLEEMGPMSRDERVMLGTMGVAVLLWVFGERLGVSAVATSMMGLCALLLSGVLTWQDCVAHSSAWDTLFWFAVLVSMSAQLNARGVISYFAGAIGQRLVAANLGWPAAFALLNVSYFALHYMFASQTAHVGALYSAFLAMMKVAGVPPVMGALSLSWMSNLMGSLTHFGSGQAAVYFGAGYISLKEMFASGAIAAVMNLAIWGTVGSMWWRWIGLV